MIPSCNQEAIVNKLDFYFLSSLHVIKRLGLWVFKMELNQEYALKVGELSIGAFRSNVKQEIKLGFCCCELGD